MQFLVCSHIVLPAIVSLTVVSLSLIAGCAIAVEHIFSGSRDTISLRRANLNPKTIRTLMLVKQRLRLARTARGDILGDQGI